MTTKVVLISGASHGIGWACATHLASRGHCVYAGTRDPSKIKHPHVHAVRLDVQDEASVQQAVREIIAQQGRIDAIINNAGYGLIGTEEMVSVAQAQAMFDVNFFGGMRLIQAVLPNMRAQKSGHIVNISSLSGFHPNALLSLYAAAKFAMEGMCLALATNVKPWNIAVAMIAPGPSPSGFASNAVMGERLIDAENPYRDYIAANLARWQARLSQGEQPQEIAELVEQILANPQPDFRYCLSSGVQAHAERLFCDPSGNTQLAVMAADCHQASGEKD